MFVTITSLTRVPTSILNAGSDGRPKQMPWGEREGDHRQYVSSQCQKYWLRKSSAFEQLGADLGHGRDRAHGAPVRRRSSRSASSKMA